MKAKKVVRKERNWALVIIASILIVLGLALIAAAILNIDQFGWWSLLIGLGGLTTVAAAVTSIVRNDPSWILIDLLLPG